MCGGRSSVHTAAVLGFSLLDSVQNKEYLILRGPLCASSSWSFSVV